MRSRGFCSGSTTISLNQQHGLAQSCFANLAHEFRTIMETLQIRPDLLNGRLCRIISESIDLINITGISKGNELGNPVLIRATSKLIQNSYTESSTLGENTNRSKSRLGKTTHQINAISIPNLRKEHSIYTGRVVDSHAVRTDNAAVILLGEVDDRLLSIKYKDLHPPELLFPPSSYFQQNHQ